MCETNYALSTGFYALSTVFYALSESVILSVVVVKANKRLPKFIPCTTSWQVAKTLSPLIQNVIPSINLK